MIPTRITSLYKTTTTTCIPKCTGHSLQKCWYGDCVNTLGKIPSTMMAFFFQYYVFRVSYIYVYISTLIYFLNAIEVSWENHCAWGVATNVPKPRTEEQSTLVWRWAASSAPNYTLSCRVTRGQQGITGRLVSLQGRPVSPAGTSALGAVIDKTMHGVVMKLSIDLLFHKFQANNRTPQCVSITNSVLCTQKSCINIYSLWKIIILGIAKYYK